MVRLIDVQFAGWAHVGRCLVTQRSMRICVAIVTLTLAVVKTVSAQDYISGYAARWTNPSGQPAEFHISGTTENAEAELHIYDVFSESVASMTVPIRPQTTAAGITRPWEEGVGFESQTLMLPDLPSGIYRMDGPDAVTVHSIPFIVGDSVTKPDTDIVVIYPTNTINAYTRTSGVNLYQRLANDRHPPAVSFQRPQEATATPRKTPLTRGLDRLLTTMGHSVNYVADYDLESYDAIANAKLVIIPGHSEYWTETARRNFDRFVDAGGSALVLSGNTMYRSVGYDDPENPTQMTFPKRQAFTQDLLGYQTYESIGVDFKHGGNGSGWTAMRDRIEGFFDGWKVLDASPSYLADAGVQAGDIIHDPAAEFDGSPFLECDIETGPVVDYEKLGFHRYDVIAFENTTSDGKFPACATWVDFDKTRDSGRIINVASVRAAMLVGDNRVLKTDILTNMIELLLIEQADFDGDEQLTTTDIDLLSFVAQVSPAPLRFDLTQDSIVNEDDVDRWLQEFANTIPGDVNVDGQVSFADFLLVSKNFGKEHATWSDGDQNLNGRVDFGDFLLLSSGFGYSSASTMAIDNTTIVPEPTHYTTSWLFLMTTLGWLRIRTVSSRKENTR